LGRCRRRGQGHVPARDREGITHPQDAKEAVARGAKGVVVSNYRGGNAAALKGTLLLVEPVVQAVGGQVRYWSMAVFVTGRTS